MRAIIIDDERLARTELKKLLQSFPEVEIIDEAANAEEGIIKIESQHPDLIFLDIQMPGKTGFDMLSQLEKTPQVIFTTAYDEFALKAFEVNALDYLLKPIEPKRLADAIQKGDAVAVKALLVRKIDVNARAADSSMPLHWAVAAGFLDCIIQVACVCVHAIRTSCLFVVW